MVILSDYQEDQQSSSFTFNAVLDPSNPLGFLESAFNFVSENSNLFKTESAEKQIMSLAHSIKERIDAEEAAEKKKKRLKQDAEKKAAYEKEQEKEKQKKLVPNTGNGLDMENYSWGQSLKKKRSKQNAKKKAAYEKEQEKEKQKKLVPNTGNGFDMENYSWGNGLDMENYSWGQSLQEVTINVPVPPGTKFSTVKFNIKTNYLKIGLKGQPPIIDGELYKAVKDNDRFCFWSSEDRREITVKMSKREQTEWWKSLLKGGPEINTQKVVPTKLSDLDIEARTAVARGEDDVRSETDAVGTSD
ncbi:hypothetical protein FH972_012602 [Carpinus fangiana]|uniref:CS domain-containing protein n=1 Tax=Carpinus fangiana TaxID=176857 RepID=A0A5N6R478_9ROSI|nr:hypothetical protein FH972_012602 [Carpinus fangiana]